MYVCMYVCMLASGGHLLFLAGNIHVCMYIYIRMYVCIYVCMYVCMYVFNVCMYVYTYVCIYASRGHLLFLAISFMYVCMYACMYVYIHTNIRMYMIYKCT